MKKIIISTMLLAVAAMAFGALFLPRRQEALFFPMGPIPFRIVAHDRSWFAFRGDLKAVRACVERLVGIFNAHDPGSELSAINRLAGKGPIPASSEMISLVRRAREWWEESGGAFDPAVGSLAELWALAGKEGRLPSEEELSSVRRLAGFGLAVEVGDGAVALANERVRLDFGAIAKGVLADAAAEILKGRGVAGGVVAAGGDLMAFGRGPARIGIRDPAGEDGIIGTLEVEGAGVSTSGDYERFVEIGERRFSHIIDPRTGRPANKGLVSATVIGSSAADADALATALVVLGREEAIALLQRLPAFRALLIERKAEEGYGLWASPELVPILRLEEAWAHQTRDASAAALFPLPAGERPALSEVEGARVRGDVYHPSPLIPLP